MGCSRAGSGRSRVRGGAAAGGRRVFFLLLLYMAFRAYYAGRLTPRRRLSLSRACPDRLSASAHRARAAVPRGNPPKSRRECARRGDAAGADRHLRGARRGDAAGADRHLRGARRRARRTTLTARGLQRPRSRSRPHSLPPAQRSHHRHAQPASCTRATRRGASRAAPKRPHKKQPHAARAARRPKRAARDAERHPELVPRSLS